MIDERVAVITGANRGLGLETARQLGDQGYRVVVAGRDLEKIEPTASELKQEGVAAIPFQLDVTDPNGPERLVTFLRDNFGRVDVLVNNAGVMPDIKNPDKASVLTADIETVREAMETNVYGPVRLSQALVPLMKENGYGRIVNLSSGMGQLADMGGGVPSYRISKTAINSLTRMLNAELEGENILVNSVCPGWVKTDMGGPGARLEVEEGVQTIVWLATQPDDGVRGGFFREKQPIPW